MTKEITRTRIIQEIQDKLKLREFEPSSFLFSETVVPVYNIGVHLEVPLVLAGTKSVTGIGGIKYWEVPENERWVLSAYNVVFMAAGAYTVAGAYITRTFIPANFMYLDLTAGQTVSYAKMLPCPVVLDPGDTLNINIDGYTSTADLKLYADVIKEEIR